MVGTSGIATARVRLVAPSARSLPACTSPCTAGTVSMVYAIWPFTTSVIDCELPLYGTCTTCTPAIELNSTDIRWLVAPEPEEANEYLPGLALSSAISSFTSFAGIEGLTTSMKGLIASRLIGEKSRSGSYATFCTLGLIEIGPLEPATSV